MKRKRHTEEQKGPRSPRVDTTFSPEKTQPEFERGSSKSLTLQFSTKVSSWKGNHSFGLQSAVMTAQAQVLDNLPITEAENSFDWAPLSDLVGADGRDTSGVLQQMPRITPRGFNFPAHRNLRVSEGVENLLR